MSNEKANRATVSSMILELLQTSEAILEKTVRYEYRTVTHGIHATAICDLLDDIVPGWLAAPDLREACKFLLKMCIGEGMDVVGGADEQGFLQARAALAKAEGEKSCDS